MNQFSKAIGVMAAIGLLLSVGIGVGAAEPPTKSQPAEKTISSKNKSKNKSAPAKAAAEGKKPAESGSPGALEGLWNQVREMMIPDEAAEGSGVRYSAVAGVRGAKSDDATFSPIWKGQKAAGAVPPDAQLYEQAKGHYAQTQYAAAVADLQQFQKLYPLSPAQPQAQLLLALGYAKTNHPAEATKTLDEFLAAHPGHPLTEQVKQFRTKLAEGAPK